MFSKSDPMVVVSGKGASGQFDSVYGKTEMVKDNQDPAFKTAVSVTAAKEAELRLAVYDLDDDNKYTEKDLLGEAFVKLSALSDKPAALPLSKGGKPVKEGSSLTVTAR